MKILISYELFQGFHLSMLPRPLALRRIDAALQDHPVVALLGPRQCGKTTLARMIAEREPCEYFDLENPVDVRRLGPVHDGQEQVH